MRLGWPAHNHPAHSRCSLELRSRCTSCATNLLSAPFGRERKRRVNTSSPSPSLLSRDSSCILHSEREGESMRCGGTCRDKLSSKTTWRRNKSDDTTNDELTWLPSLRLSAMSFTFFIIEAKGCTRPQKDTFARGSIVIRSSQCSGTQKFSFFLNWRIFDLFLN